MSLNSPILSRRSAEVAAGFDATAASYEAAAGLQQKVALRLAELLPDARAPKVLELGCGTGLMSRLLVTRYPDGDFILTDAAPAMIRQCRRNLEGRRGRVAYEVMDASRPGRHDPFDLIITSMMLHWLREPVAGVSRLRGLLKPGGVLLYATLGPDSFAEWRTVLATEGLPVGVLDLPAIPGVVAEDHMAPDRDALSFLRRIKAVGGLTPREGYRPMPSGALRRALRAANRQFGGRVTWHIVYGRLEPA